MLYLDNKRDANKAIKVLHEVKDLPEKQQEALNAVLDLLDELLIEGRW